MLRCVTSPEYVAKWQAEASDLLYKVHRAYEQEKTMKAASAENLLWGTTEQPAQHWTRGRVLNIYTVVIHISHLMCQEKRFWFTLSCNWCQWCFNTGLH